MRWGGRRNKEVGNGHDSGGEPRLAKSPTDARFRQVADWERCCKYRHSPSTRMIPE